ncbi:MAG: hypothetical protein F3745_09515 [Nitrospinae bacterium]|nr:hypothetical protein [Nitrospinota bacterium]
MKNRFLAQLKLIAKLLLLVPGLFMVLIVTANAGVSSSSTGYKISSIDSSLESIQDNDETAENNTFEIEGNAFLDFTATNPFGEANFIDE